ncbi:hypothetical protein U9M48_015873 [Paspalum notatum var. saurae]|uniref:Reverse transcriptase domain-containing protein n=1 Tax=Paspalum notatum var. saurae TaxID=547442 RepID=A0AAQ3T7F0_PASNO
MEGMVDDIKPEVNKECISPRQLGRNSGNWFYYFDFGKDEHGMIAICSLQFHDYVEKFTSCVDRIAYNNSNDPLKKSMACERREKKAFYLGFCPCARYDAERWSRPILYIVAEGNGKSWKGAPHPQLPAGRVWARLCEELKRTDNDRGQARDDKSLCALFIVAPASHQDEIERQVVIVLSLLIEEEGLVLQLTSYPPIIEELLDELGQASWFTSLDLTRRRISPGQKRLRGGIASHGFWVVRSSAMNSSLAPYLRKFVLVFFDDILIYSPTFEEHIALHLGIEDGKVKLSKCTFASQQLTRRSYFWRKELCWDPSKIGGLLIGLHLNQRRSREVFLVRLVTTGTRCAILACIVHRPSQHEKAFQALKTMAPVIAQFFTTAAAVRPMLAELWCGAWRALGLFKQGFGPPHIGFICL